MPDKHNTANTFAPPEGMDAGGFQSAPPTEIRVEKALEPKSSPDLVQRYQLGAVALQIEPKVVYYPCSAWDSSPSAAFPESRIIYVEMDRQAVKDLNRTGHEAHCASAKEFVPDTPVDLLILLNPSISSEKPASTVRSGGHVFCNDYHGTAHEILANPDFEFCGVLVPVGEGYHFDDQNLQDYWKTVETDAEFKQARAGFTRTSYDTARRQTAAMGIEGGSVLERYKNLVGQARDQFRECMKSILAEGSTGINTDPEKEDLLLFRGPGFPMPVMINTHLPTKKGTVDDIYVFRKK